MRLSVRLLVLLPVALLVLSGLGCVRRRLTITTSPPGATVFVDNREIGITPVSTSFIYYGTREIRIVADGFETLTVRQRFDPPWYQVTPIDFFAENVYPFEIRDERELAFQLVPQKIFAPQETVARAQQLRDDARRGLVTSSPNTQGGFFTAPTGQPAPPPVVPSAQVVPQPLPANTAPGGIPANGAPGGFQYVQPQPLGTPQPEIPPPPEFRFFPNG